MHGVKRVVLFCVTIVVLPTVLIITPLYLRHSVFADVEYFVAESDVVAIKDGLSSIFCESHTLRMNASFNAFKLSDHPVIGKKMKHIRLKKSMSLPDDTLEYWGFFLLRGATVSLKVCSRYEGSRILVVRGERNLRTCGLLDHNLGKFGATMDKEHRRVKVTFETPAQLIEDSQNDSMHKVPTYDPNTAAEVISSADDVDLYIKQRLNKGRKSLLHKTNNTEAVNLGEGTINQINFNTTTTEKQINSGFESESKERNATMELHHKRHAKRKFLKKQEELYRLQESLKSNEEVDMVISRPKRETGLLLDGGIEHGGTALNYTSYISDESSVSSFETSLLTCYDGSILLTQEFAPSHLCENVHYLDNVERLETVHEVATDGYYYYIFYSDNDFVRNDIHAVFDIYKPTFQYNNISETNKCLNATQCTFPISFWTDQTVIVEVPTRDGIEHEGDDFTLLMSTCHPRMSVYMIFPISVMFLILGCAFL